VTPSLLVGVLGAASSLCASAALVVRADRVVLGRLEAVRREPVAGRHNGVTASVWRVIARVGALHLFRGGAKRDQISRRLRSATWHRSSEEILGLERLGAWSFAALLLVAPAPLPVLGPLVALVVMRIPDLMLAGVEKARRKRADAELPQLLDLLAGASSAGLAAPAAFRRALSAVSGPLGEDLAGVVRAVDLGARWRDELRHAADRMELPDLRRAVGALTRTESLGSSLSSAMAELAADVRASRRARASERARTAPVKMLFPLVFLVLPAFLLLTVVPVLLSTVRSIR
jgi:Flp pilus assembly protein TadB